MPRANNCRSYKFNRRFKKLCTCKSRLVPPFPSSFLLFDLKELVWVIVEQVDIYVQVRLTIYVLYASILDFSVGLVICLVVCSCQYGRKNRVCWSVSSTTQQEKSVHALRSAYVVRTNLISLKRRPSRLFTAICLFSSWTRKADDVHLFFLFFAEIWISRSQSVAIPKAKTSCSSFLF